MNRTKAREKAFQLLFQKEIQKTLQKEDIDIFLSNNNIEDEEAIKYIKDIALGTEKNQDNISRLIEKNLKNEWKIDRVSKVDLSILKLAIYEMIYKKLPYKVVIDEAVELAKKYGEDTSSSFVNGILASILKENLWDQSQWQ